MQLMTLDIENCQSPIPLDSVQKIISSLEQGQVIFLPKLSFRLSEEDYTLLQTPITSNSAKNISYDHYKSQLKGVAKLADQQKQLLQSIMVRFHNESKALIDNVLPHYQTTIKAGRTSLRTQEAAGRKSSPKKNDNRLHVDAFPSTPMGDQRILRVFCNINPHNQPRVWHLGEPFTDIVKRFITMIEPPLPGMHCLLKLFKITKKTRTCYDHYMLQIHDRMKLDLKYQREAPKVKIKFPSGSSWIVFSDVTPHAALSGQYMLEQTFYLPYQAMQQPSLSPQMILGQQLQLAKTNH